MSIKLRVNFGLVLLLSMGLSFPLFATKGWTPITRDQAEYNRLTSQCADLAERYPSGSSALEGVIFHYLKNIGTPVSLRVLKEQIKMGRLQKNCLDLI